MTFFVHINILLRFLKKFFSKYYIYFNSSPPLPGSFVTVTLNSGISTHLDLFNAIYDQLQHENIMSSLANCYYDYVVNKLNHLNTLTVKDSVYELSNLKPIINTKVNDIITFTFKPLNININLPIINIVNFCLHNIYIIIPAIFFTLKPILISISTNLDILLEKLLNLSKNCWCLIIDNIIRHNNNKIKYKLIEILLIHLINQFKIKIIKNEVMTSIYNNDKAIADDFGLYTTPEEYRDLERRYIELCKDQDECKDILNTIRILDNIILNNFNSEHVVNPPHYLDQDIG